MQYEEKEKVMEIMSDWLLVLRSSLNISQEQIAKYLGFSRQTYSALELKKRKFTWNMFLAVFCFFMVNDCSRGLLEKKQDYIQNVKKLLSVSDTMKG